MNLGDLIERVRAYDGEADAQLIRRAFDFSARVHEGQTRASGEPFFTHPLEVAFVIAYLKLDVASVVTGLLHDTVEDTLTTLEEIEGEFGEEIATLVDGVTKLSEVFTNKEKKQAENFRKIIVAMSRDIRVLLIKLADRTHNMRTLDSLSPARREAIARETLDIYVPFAHRLGIYWMKSELEDNALRYLHPEVYYQLKRNIAKKKGERERHIEQICAVLSRRLEENGIEAEVTGRPKHFFSIYQKMERQNLNFEQIHDIVAFRAVVDSERDCYAVLGVVHNEWKPIAGRFKDYIALPKVNMYQSLHTTVVGPGGQRMEVQIRTHSMHRIAEEGIAAHWRYKEGGTLLPKDSGRLNWLRKLLEWRGQDQDPAEFIRSIKDDLVSDEVVVFTPQGQSLSFPKGSSIVDFAYHIHSDVGHHCAGARVNGQIVPLRHRLRDGDRVEVISTAHQNPSKDWLNFVKTSRARVKIRNWIKFQQRTRSIDIGKAILQKELAKHGLSFDELRSDGRLESASSQLGQKGEESLFAAVGYGRLTSQEVLARLLPPDELLSAKKRAGNPLRRLLRILKPEKSEIRVSGIEDIVIRFGRCCDPLPGERILGFITRGRGVTVHSVECHRVLDNDPQRRVEVEWEDGAVGPRDVSLHVSCVDRQGLLAATSAEISSLGVNISDAKLRVGSRGEGSMIFEVTVDHVDQLNGVLRAVEKVDGVLKAQRGRRDGLTGKESRS